MTKKLLIDGVYPEETRVALVDEKNRLLEYDFSSIAKETVKGNIYLAKVMRVEPSLQAAFVEYGGNRHGFLAFSEIHPDYFRIPVSDREALSAQLYDQAYIDDEDDLEEPSEDGNENSQDEVVSEDASDEKEGDESEETLDFENSVSTISGESIEPVDQGEEDVPHVKRPQLHRMYKIQEVVHKNQILLIQVVKEERGQKGAALTTYLSLAGRYCVLMPNSPHAGGISRKIAQSSDRKRLRSVLEGLGIPREMGLIIRTAGKDRSKVEIKRDTDYLMRQWEEIRQDTLQSIAPKLIYQEDTIIRRSLRDLYGKDVKEVIVDGAESYKTAKDFMKRLMPSHAKDVVQHKDPVVPLFTSHRIEKQLEQMYNPVVPLPSGGSIVIHPTEALVSIDINSGRATRERHITGTALNTNLEAAAEIARQVRMRDLAGLIVIDFIDMEDRRHVQQVERKVREAFRDDRARVQMSKISPFGLLELSRQRLRPSILETTSVPCHHCQSTGFVRSTESMGLQIMRVLEEEGFAGRSAKVKVQVPYAVAWYILNDKRRSLSDLENRHGMIVEIQADETLIIPDYRLLQLERKVGAGAGRGEIVVDADQDNAPKNPSQSKTQSADRDSEKGEGKRSDRNRNRHKDKRNENRSKPKADEAKDVNTTGVEEVEGAEGDGSKESSNKRRNRYRNRRRDRRNRPEQGEEGQKVATESTGSEHKARADASNNEPSKMNDVVKDQGDEKPKDSKAAPKGRARTTKGKASPKKDKLDVPQTQKAAAVVDFEPKEAAVSSEVSKTAPKTAAEKKGRKPKNWLKRLLE